ncbi:MAG: hypothetical protein ACOYZ8_10530 [Chloroflexota bacterium]
MKRSFLLLFALTLAACSVSLPDLFAGTPVPSPLPPTETLIPSPTFTITPTQPTPTFTSTPTLIPLGATRTPLPSATADGSLTPPAPTNALLFMQPESGMVSAVVTSPQIFWGGCEASSTQFTVRALDPSVVAFVSVFTRLESKKSGAVGPWDSGTVFQNNGPGVFTLVLEADAIQGHENYPNSWVHLQFVTTDSKEKTIGRSEVFTRNLSLAPCP